MVSDSFAKVKDQGVKAASDTGYDCRFIDLKSKSDMAVVQNKIIRMTLLILGVTSVVLGVIGAFLPIIPTTPFILLAAWCFLKSSVRAHDWLHRQPVFGEILRNWEKNRAIARKTKIVAISMITVSLLVIWMQVKFLWLKIAVTVLLVAVALFIWTRNEVTGE